MAFKPNPAQQVFHKHVMDEFTRNRLENGMDHCKIITTKGRQEGISTYVEKFNSDHMLNTDQYRLLTMAHREEETNILFSKYQHTYENLPDKVILTKDGRDITFKENGTYEFGDPTPMEIKPSKKSYSGTRMAFADSTMSAMRAMTAGGGDAVNKGDTLSAFHASEFANFTKAKAALNTVENQLPDNGFVFSVLESTANGTVGDGKEFYERYIKAEHEYNRYMRGELPRFIGYLPVFVGWYLLPKYSLALFDRTRSEDYSDPAKVDFYNTDRFYDLSQVEWSDSKRKQFFERAEMWVAQGMINLEQLNWYFYCMAKKCGNDYNEAMRYYPWVSEDAFTATDNTFFNTSALHTVKTNLDTKGEPPHQLGRLEDGDEDIVFEEHPRGELRVTEHPQPGYVNRYVVGADLASGIQGGDAAVFPVLDRLRQRFVAQWRGHADENELAEILVMIGLYYNEALLVPESNMATVINIIQPGGFLPYPGEIYIQNVESRNSQEYGFRTDGHNRGPLLKQYKTWLRENGYDTIDDPITLEEHRKFERSKPGITPTGAPKKERFAAADGYNDDIVLGRALSVEGHMYLLRDGVDVEQDKQAPGRDIIELATGRRDIRQVRHQSKLGRGSRRGAPRFGQRRAGPETELVNIGQPKRAGKLGF